MGILVLLTEVFRYLFPPTLTAKTRCVLTGGAISGILIPHACTSVTYHLRVASTQMLEFCPHFEIKKLTLRCCVTETDLENE